MGEVYRAKDTRLDRIVAIKVLPAHLSDRPELSKLFEREARARSQEKSWTWIMRITTERK